MSINIDSRLPWCKFHAIYADPCPWCSVDALRSELAALTRKLAERDDYIGHWNRRRDRAYSELKDFGLDPAGFADDYVTAIGVMVAELTQLRALRDQLRAVRRGPNQAMYFDDVLALIARAEELAKE